MENQTTQQTTPDAMVELKEIEAKAVETAAALQPPADELGESKQKVSPVQASGLFHEVNGEILPTWEVLVSILIRKFGAKGENGDCSISINEQDLLDAALPGMDLLFASNKEGTAVTLAVVKGEAPPKPLTQEEARKAVLLATDIKKGVRSQDSLTEEETALLVGIGRSMSSIAGALKECPKEAAMWNEILDESRARMEAAMEAAPEVVADDEPKNDKAPE